MATFCITARVPPSTVEYASSSPFLLLLLKRLKIVPVLTALDLDVTVEHTAATFAIAASALQAAELPRVRGWLDRVLATA